MRNSWKDKQRLHLEYFKNGNPEQELDWYKTYGPLVPYIEKHGFEITVADIGCGAFPYSLTFPFAEVFLVDTHLEEYAKIPWSTVGKTDRHVPFDASVVFFDPQSHAIFLFNFLDNLPPDGAAKVLKQAAKARLYVAGYVDYRRKPDKRHYVWSESLDEHLSPLRKVVTIPCSRPGVKGELFFYER